MGWEMGLEPTTTGITILSPGVLNQCVRCDFGEQKYIRPRSMRLNFVCVRVLF